MSTELGCRRFFIYAAQLCLLSPWSKTLVIGEVAPKGVHLHARFPACGTIESPCLSDVTRLAKFCSHLLSHGLSKIAQHESTRAAILLAVLGWVFQFLKFWLGAACRDHHPGSWCHYLAELQFCLFWLASCSLRSLMSVLIFSSLRFSLVSSRRFFMSSNMMRTHRSGCRAKVRTV